MVDLTNVDFITFKEKRCRNLELDKEELICEEQYETLEYWSKLRGKEITITDEDIMEW